MRIPWETIIKTYRAELFDKRFASLEECASDFINFFERENIFFPSDVQSDAMSDCLRNGFYRLRNQIDKAVESIIKEIGSIDEEQVKVLVGEKITVFLAELYNFSSPGQLRAPNQ